MAGDKRLRKPDEDFRMAAPIPGFPGYFITHTGVLYSVKRMKFIHHSDGYERACLYGTSRGKKRVGLHQLLARAFLESFPGQTEVRHLDGNKKNNRLYNLAWGTRRDNAHDLLRHGGLRGEANGNAKLSASKVIRIRILRAHGVRRRALARIFRVTESCIKRVVERRSWAHV